MATIPSEEMIKICVELAREAIQQAQSGEGAAVTRLSAALNESVGLVSTLHAEVLRLQRQVLDLGGEL
jgi:hypothetical protein